MPQSPLASLPRSFSGREEYRAWWEENAPVAYGFCWCGCGERTSKATRNDAHRGVVKGEPRRFVNNHRAFRSADPVERFWAKVDRAGDCWLWRGSRDPGGYGRFNLKLGGERRPVLAHRFAFELGIGPIPEGMFVCHRCDTPACVRPGHLWLGTAAENTRDMIEKGRKVDCPAVGEGHPGARLTEGAVRRIRADYAAGGVSGAQLARRHGVTKSAIYRIVNGEGWRHVS